MDSFPPCKSSPGGGFLILLIHLGGGKCPDIGTFSKSVY